MSQKILKETLDQMLTAATAHVRSCDITGNTGFNSGINDGRVRRESTRTMVAGLEKDLVVFAQTKVIESPETTRDDKRTSSDSRLLGLRRLKDRSTFVIDVHVSKSITDEGNTYSETNIAAGEISASNSDHLPTDLKEDEHDLKGLSERMFFKGPCRRREFLKIVSIPDDAPRLSFFSNDSKMRHIAIGKEGILSQWAQANLTVSGINMQMAGQTHFPIF